MILLTCSWCGKEGQAPRVGSWWHALPPGWLTHAPDYAESDVKHVCSVACAVSEDGAKHVHDEYRSMKRAALEVNEIGRLKAAKEVAENQMLLKYGDNWRALAGYEDKAT